MTLEVPGYGGNSGGVAISDNESGGGLQVPGYGSGGGDGTINFGGSGGNHGFMHLNDLTNAVGLGGAAHFVSNEIGTSAHDLENILIHGPIGAVQFATQLPQHPIRTLGNFAQSVGNDFTLHNIVHHPLYAALDLTAALDLGASTAARAAAVRGIVSRGGKAGFADAETARAMGHEAAYNRAIDPTTGDQIPVGQQVRQALLRGAPAQRRIIQVPKGDYLGNNALTENLTVPGHQIEVGDRFSFNGREDVAKDVKPPALDDTIRVTGEGGAIHTIPSEANVNVTRLLPKEETAIKSYIPQELGDYARSFTWRTAQKVIDRAHVTFPEARIPVLGKIAPRVFGSEGERIQAAERSAMVYKRNALRRPAAALVAAARGLDTPQQLAIRVVAEGASIPERIKFHEQEMASGGLNKRQLSESKKQILLLKQTQKYIHYDEVGGRMTPLIKPEFEKLADIVDQSRTLSHHREGLIGPILADANAVGRKINPLRTILGHGIPESPEKIASELKGLVNFNKDGRMDEKIADAKTRLQEALAAEQNPGMLGDEQLSEEYLQHLFRVPYATKPAYRSLLGGAARYQGGKNAPPSTVTHAFQAGYLKHGGGRNDIVNLMAESYSEAARYMILKQARNRILQLSYKSPQELIQRGIKVENIVAINTDALRGGVSSDLMRQWRAEKFGGSMPEETLSPEEAQAIGSQYDELRKQIFQDYHESLQMQPNYVFADRRVLGGLDEPNPLTGVNARSAGREGLKFVDAVNNSVKAAILYLKPAYLFPNWLGNVALGFVHQGFAAPANLYKASRMEHSLGREATGALDVIMGGGISDTLLPQGAGGFSRVSSGANKLGSFYGSGKIKIGDKERKLFPGIDDPSRRAAFYHEAISAGFDTPEKMKKLLLDDEYRNQMETIAQRAAKEIIDYEDLGPWEQAVIRRVVFFYPWVKGATRYGLHFAQDHPLAAAVNADFAKTGEEEQKAILGRVPAYAESLIPFGHKKDANGHPYGISPSSASILETPGDVVRSIHNLFTGNANKDLSLFGNVAPFDSALFTLASGQVTNGPTNPNDTIAEAALKQLYGGLPLSSLIQAFTSPAGSNRVYPAASGEWHGIPLRALIAASRFGLFGGLTPRPYNPTAGAESADREENSFS